MKEAIKDDCSDIRDNPGDTRTYQLSEIPGGMCFDRGQGGSLRQTERTLIQQMADITTEKLVGEMFREPAQIRRFLTGFVDCVNYVLEDYLQTHNLKDSVFLIYKGGNVLSDYFAQFLNIRDQERDQTHAQFLKKSDADFQFYITTPQLFDLHSDYLKRLVIVALYKFANWLKVNPCLPATPFISAASFTELAFNHNKTRRINGRLKVIHAEPSDRSDFLVISSNGTLLSRVVRREPKTCDMYIVPVQPIVADIPKNWSRPVGVYITFNDTLRFGQDKSRASFDLARMKLDVKVTAINRCEYHAPAELIDVSFSNKDDRKYKHQYEANAPMHTWTQVKSLDNGTTVLIPTLEYLVNHDLQNILFFETGGYPWNDPKYSKRMYRYILGSAMVCTNDTDVVQNESQAGRWAQFGTPIIDVMGRLVEELNFAALNAVHNVRISTPAVPFKESVAQLALILSKNPDASYTNTQRQTFFMATHQFAQVQEMINQVRSKVIEDADALNQADDRVTNFNTMMDTVVAIIELVKLQLNNIMETDEQNFLNNQRPENSRSRRDRSRSNVFNSSSTYY